MFNDEAQEKSLLLLGSTVEMEFCEIYNSI